MARNESKRINPDTLVADESAAAAVALIADYQPDKAKIGKEAVAACLADYRAAHQRELDIEGDLATARDGTVAAGWKLHNLMLEVKSFVEYHYGTNSDELQRLGLKKKSEYKARSRRTPTSAA
jgi:hypothetical protein